MVGTVVGATCLLLRTPDLATSAEIYADQVTDTLALMSTLVDFLVIKVTRSGGIWPTLLQIAVAQAAGLPLIASGLTDGFITKIAACQVALASGFAGPAALNGSQFTDEDALFPRKALMEREGVVRLNDLPGLGVAPDEDALQAALDKELSS